MGGGGQAADLAPALALTWGQSCSHSCCLFCFPYTLPSPPRSFFLISPGPKQPLLPHLPFSLPIPQPSPLLHSSPACSSSTQPAQLLGGLGWGSAQCPRLEWGWSLLAQSNGKGSGEQGLRWSRAEARENGEQREEKEKGEVRQSEAVGGRHEQESSCLTSTPPPQHLLPCSNRED